MSKPTSKLDPPTVRELLEALGSRLELEVLAGEAGLERSLLSGRLQKPGLALTGSQEYLTSGCLQVLGRSEIRYLSLGDEPSSAAIEGLCDSGAPALLLTRGLDPPDELRRLAQERGVPLLRTPRDTGDAMELLYHFMAVRLAPKVKVHGVLMDIFGLGVLILGESGIGKSECALELVTRGHRLVADDAVEIRLIEDELVGTSPDISRHYLEVRGLGLINAREMFGITAVRETKAVEEAIRLVHFEVGKPYERLGESQGAWEVLGHRIPLREIPVAPGRNLAVLLEIAARQQLLREHGVDAVREIQANLARKLVPPGGDGQRRE